ncbi:MAG: hypothetical protein DRI90_16250 [Deltaproteobacteria bacterium]|nr:MAG: hypothetical protein DRI90_16250 [Deltaproteobacteria bacterium]
MRTPAHHRYTTTSDERRDLDGSGELAPPPSHGRRGGLALTGSHPGCTGGEGLFDMMGNLHEWTADPLGTFRGGFYVDTVINGEGCLYVTTAHDVLHWDYSTRFRCCADP